ncbi:MAG: O-antigen ligase family protein [Butyrivibrio sp.]|nr:O-antigen ligase family protein [Butyrivibrio sp.]
MLYGKSPFEFVGVLRNLYACALIFFAVDAGILGRKEILNGLVLLVFISEIIALATTMADCILGDYLPDYFADHRFVACAGVVLIPYAVLKAGRSPKLVLVYWGLIVPNVLLCGRRTETTVVFGLMILMYLCMLFKKNKEMIRLFAWANVLGVVLTIILSIVLIRGFDSWMAWIHLFRGMPWLAHIIPDDWIRGAMRLAMESGQRSNAVRAVLWSAFWERIRQSPLIGVGERTIRIDMETALKMLGGLSLGYDIGEEQVMVAHNFILELMSVEGVLGLLAYAGMMFYLYFNVLIRFKMDWLEKFVCFAFTGTFYAFALVQPSVTGGITSNIYIWSFLGYIYAENRIRESGNE